MKLFTPLKFGKKEIQNRFVMAPMTRSKSPGGIPTDEVVNYYKKRAEGRVGLIITEGLPINHPGAQGYPDVPNLYNDEAKSKWKEIVGSVHKSGSLIIPQIWHVGSMKHRNFDPEEKFPTYSASGIIHPSLVKAGLSKPKATEMSDEQISDVIDAFSDSAKLSQELGFDGVEVHGAHGYLIDQFFSDTSNLRNDDYAGSISKRTKFAREVISKIKKDTSKDFPLVFRFSQWKVGDYDVKNVRNEKELEEMLTPLVDAGVDVFHVSTRDLLLPEFEGSNLTLAGWTKKITNKPVIAVGGVGINNDDETNNYLEDQINKVEECIVDQDIDLVALGRCLISDADFVSKLENKEYSAINKFKIEDIEQL